MKVTADAPPELGIDRPQRIVEAMRASIAQRGATGSTFDHVAREAGVSRGLLHYHFGTKEALLVEVARRDCEIRLVALDGALAGAPTAEDFIDVLVRSLEEMVGRDPGFVILLFELFALARRHDGIAAEMAELGRRTRAAVAERLAERQAAGVLALADEPEAVAGVLFALADGLAVRMLAEPQTDPAPFLRAAVTAARALLLRPQASS